MGWEAQLAKESSSLDDEARLNFLEDFALADGPQQKRALVLERFVPGTPDFWFYDALCAVLELQALVEAGDQDEQAWARLEQYKGALETTEQQLSSCGCRKRVERLQHRRLMLELELSSRLKRPLVDVTRRITTALQVNHLDPEPQGVGVSVRQEALPTELSQETLDLDQIIQQKLVALKFDHNSVGTLKRFLACLDVFGREKMFQNIRSWEGSEDERWKLLEVFLDEYAFEYTNIPGYLDIIVEDVARSKEKHNGNEWNFNFRAAQRNLSFPQLVECAQRAPERFRDNGQFASRGIQLLQAAANVEISQTSCHRDNEQRAKELQHIETYLEFLSGFSDTAVDGIRATILYRKLEVLILVCWSNPSIGEQLLKALVKYVNIAGGGTLRYFSFTGETGFHTLTQWSHEKIIAKSLYMLWSSGADENIVTSALSEPLGSAYLETQHALAMIKLGQGEFSNWTAKLPDKGQELSSKVGSSELTFCESNPTNFMPEDPLRIYVRTRNVKTLRAHLYEIKTMEYYTRLRREIKGDISLDGLLPTEEKVINLSHLSAWQESRVPIEFLAPGKRGVFVVEVFENGMTCRAILRRGFLRHVERITNFGHEFTVLDERGSLLKDAQALVLNLKSGVSKAQLGREYTADNNGVITVPFRHPNDNSQDKFAIVFKDEAFGSFFGTFDYLTEAFDVSIDMHIDTEQLIPGAVAQLVARPRVLVAGIATGESLELLVGVNLVIEFDLMNTSNTGSNSHKEVQTFATMQEVVDTPPNFEIPMDAKSFSVTLNGRVARVGTPNHKDLPQVTETKHFDVQRVNDFSGTYTPHLVRRAIKPADPNSPSEFSLFVLGHNGEAVPAVRVELSFKHVHYTDTTTALLQTDASGAVKLGRMENISQVGARLTASSTHKWEWELPNLRSYRPQIVNCSIGEDVEIPIPFAFADYIEGWMDNELVSVCEVVDTILQLASQSSRLQVMKNRFGRSIGLTANISCPGNYLVYVRPLDLKYPVTVYDQSGTELSVPAGLIIQPTKVLLTTPTRPLMICSQELKSEGGKKVLEIHLGNAHINSTRVIVTFKHFLDVQTRKISEVIVGDGLTKFSSAGVRLPKLSFRSLSQENDYLKKRKISDEYSYILQRRALMSDKLGSSLHLDLTSLSKPSLLQNPYVVSETEMEVVTAQAGEAVTGFKTAAAQSIRSGGARNQLMKKKKSARSRMASSLPSISFLGKQSQIISSPVNNDGVIRIDLSNVDFISGSTGSFEVCTVAFDCRSGFVCTQESTVLISSENSALAVPKRDIRLSAAEALSPEKHFQQADTNECVRAGEVKVLPRSFSSKYAVYESLESAIDLWPTLTSGSDVTELASKLKQWKQLPLKEKLPFYYANACDDLHIYISQKDPGFFDQYARPLISSKICKSLVDYCVLNDEANLRRLYLGPAVYQRLSCVEKLLVARGLSKVEDRDRICQAVIHEIESAYPSRCSSTTLSNLFNTVLSQGQVDPIASTPNPSDVFGSSAPAMPPPGGFGGVTYLPTSPAYSPTSPAYAPTSAAYPCASGFSFGACAAPRQQMQQMQQRQYAMLASRRSPDETTYETIESTECVNLAVEEDDEEEGDFGIRSLDSDESEEDDVIALDDDDDEEEDESAEDKTKKRKKVDQELPYIPPGKVRKVQEKRYFANQEPSFVGRNRFWKEYAEYLMSSKDQRFISSYFPEALTSITEGLIALAILDLPSEATPPDVQLVNSTGTQVRLLPTSDVVLYHRSIGPAESSQSANSVLVLKQRIRDENNDECAELVVNKVYTTTVSISNIGSVSQNNISLLLQIPQGSIPMGGKGFYTKNEITSVEPNHTREFSFSFYFPVDGEFCQYPARASSGREVVAWTSLQVEHSTLKVVRSATRVNLASWNDVSARGTLQEVLSFIQSAGPGVRIDYEKLCWRCHNDEFFVGIVEFLRDKLVFVSNIWKYGLLHHDERVMTEFFGSSEVLAQSIGSGFHSSFMDQGSLHRNERFGSAFDRFDYCEFGPFLTRRVHPMTGQVNALAFGSTAKTSGNRILNDEARRYFRELCERLGMRTCLDGKCLLVLTFYMILFDRTDKALAIFSRLEKLSPEMKAGVEETVQYVYLDAFLDFFRYEGDETGRKFSVARRAIAQYADHPQLRWRLRFQGMQEYLEEFDAFETQKLGQLEQMEIVDAPVDRTRSTTITNTRRSQVKLEATIAANRVDLASQSLGQCEVSFYPIDLELMFSTEPFNTSSDSTSSASSLLFIEPQYRQMVDITAVPSDDGLTKMAVQIPGELAATQMMVRVREIPSSRTITTVAPPIDIIRPYLKSSLSVDVMTQCGMLQVLHDGLPVRACYVKVYAKVSSSGVGRTKTEFYKDGYTDLLGKFDYVGINGDLITRVEKFAILISHAKFGASVQQVDPPVLASTVGDFSHQQERDMLLY